MNFKDWYKKEYGKEIKNDDEIPLYAKKCFDAGRSFGRAEMASELAQDFLELKEIINNMLVSV